MGLAGPPKGARGLPIIGCHGLRPVGSIGMAEGVHNDIFAVTSMRLLGKPTLFMFDVNAGNCIQTFAGSLLNFTKGFMFMLPRILLMLLRIVLMVNGVNVSIGIVRFVGMTSAAAALAGCLRAGALRGHVCATRGLLGHAGTLQGHTAPDLDGPFNEAAADKLEGFTAKLEGLRQQCIIMIVLLVYWPRTRSYVGVNACRCML